MTSTFCRIWIALPVLLGLSLPSLSAQAKPPWRVGGGNARLETEGNVSRLSGKGWVRTSRAYLDVRVKLDFRVVDSRSAGALLLRAVIPPPGAAAVSGYRVALRPGDKVSVKTLAEQPARVTAIPAVTREGEWHHLEVHAIRDQVTVSLDGQVAATIEGREHQTGYVGLEIERGTMEFRAIRVSEANPSACRDDPKSRVADSATPDRSAVTLPRVQREVRATYTIEALNDRAEGPVWVEAVVLPDGTVGETCVRKSVHPDLDAEAMAAARQWRFTPGTRHDQPVSVLITIELDFTLEGV